VSPSRASGKSDNLLDKLRTSLDKGTSGRFIVAYSGGIDSSVLLHAAVNLLGTDSGRLIAAHVDHGLHNDSEHWAQRCRATAARLGVSVTVMQVDESPVAGESVEAWARLHRYRLLQSVIGGPEDTLMTAHHRDDLAETVLLQLFRGAGPHGLASIPERRRFGRGFLLRPLLSVTRDEIAAYAQTHHLHWIDDPSNAADEHDRNYIRHRVMPSIEQRWPAVSARIAHVVDLQQQAAACLDSAADSIVDLALSDDAARLSISVLSGVSDDMQRWVVRRWIVRSGYPIPDAVHLHEMQRLVRARPDAEPCVNWKQAEMRRYRGLLYLRWAGAAPDPDCDSEYRWNMDEPLALPNGILSAETVIGAGLNKALAGKRNVVVRFRRGGERCHPLERAHSQSLKRLFQEWGVPPWEREATPLVFIDGELAAVAGRCICRGFAADVGESGWNLHWRSHPDGVRTPGA